jgi:hypothetical protein
MAPAAIADPAPVVVELFTSQGCESCPPADRLLGELARRPGVIALAYHVDYWDHLGWKDRFGLPEASARQRAYAHAMALSSVYTPQMVIDGTTDVVGSDRPAVLAALKAKPDGAPIHLSCADGKLMIAIAPSKIGGPAEITVVAYIPEAETKVARGENAGRTLTEYSIVRAVRPMGRWDGEAKQLGLDLTLPDGATMAAVLVQGAGEGPMMGAATTQLR